MSVSLGGGREALLIALAVENRPTSASQTLHNSY